MELNKKSGENRTLSNPLQRFYIASSRIKSLYNTISSKFRTLHLHSLNLLLYTSSTLAQHILVSPISATSIGFDTCTDNSSILRMVTVHWTMGTIKQSGFSASTEEAVQENSSSSLSKECFINYRCGCVGGGS